MSEDNSNRSFVSIILVFFLLVPVMTGELNAFELVHVSHHILIVKKHDAQSRQDTHFFGQLNGKQEESRSKKSTYHSFACTVSESLHCTIHQLSNSFVITSPRLEGSITRVPLYLSKRALLI